MTKKPTLSELLRRWERNPVSPEELCRDCPELFDELCRRIVERLHTSDSASQSTVDPETPPTNVPQRGNASRPKQTDKEVSGDPDAVEFSKRPTLSHEFHPADESDDPTPPRYIDRYRLDEQIGRGGFGEVWKGFDAELDRVVAVKVPRSDRMYNVDLIANFMEEARKAASLRHENIVRVHDVRCQDDLCFIISEYVGGKNLRETIRTRQWSIRDKVRVVADLAAALHFAHGRGIIHRDVKPANILMTDDGKPCLTDFGLAVTEEEQLHEPAGFCGTPKYMSPEQARGEGRRADPRTDVYSLGVVFYEMLANRTPYKAGSSKEYLKQILHKDPWPLRSLDDSIPHEIERICLKCLAKAPGNRYSSAGDLAKELRQWLRESEPSTNQTQKRNAASTAPVRWIALALLTAVVLLVAWWGLFGNRSSNDSGGDSHKKKQTRKQPKEIDKPLKKVDPLAWVDRLNIEPKELIWPGYSATGSWYMDKKNGALVVASSGLKLIQLGEILPGVDYKITMTVLQPQWVGAAGIFFGYSVVDEKPVGKRAAIQVLRLVRSRDEQKKHVMQFRRRKVLVTRGTGSLVGGFERHQNLGLPNTVQSFELTIEIIGNKFRSVRWGEMKLDQLSNNDANGLFEPGDYVGPWGVYGSVGTTFFINAKQTALTKEK